MVNLFHIIQTQFSDQGLKLDKSLIEVLDRVLDLTPEDLAVHIYRLQRLIIERKGEDNVSGLLRTLSFIQRMYTQIEIYYSAQIGKNFKITHGLGTVIGARVVIGDNVRVFQNVTIGAKRAGERKPFIGNNVVLYAGSKVLGNVTLGDNVIVGANAVVLMDVPKNAIVGGIPARVLRVENNAR